MNNVQLSPEQREIVEATEGAHLVLASAGSGKTRVLTERVKLLLSSRQRRYRVLALTFTNRAADELRERLRDVEDIGERAFVGTIHAFCQMVLESHYAVLGEGDRMPTILSRDEDRMVLMEEALKAVPSLGKAFEEKSPKDQRIVLGDLLATLSAAKRSFSVGLPGVSDLLCKEYAEELRDAFENEMDRQNSIDFDDLLVLTYRVFTEQTHVLEHFTRLFRHICVDEAQDLNRIQYEIIRLLALPNRNVLLVGCKSQAIYGFNGASIEYMDKIFSQDFEPVRRHVLTKNYRSAKAIIMAANPLADSSDDHMNPDDAAFPGECRVFACSDEASEASWIVGKIRELLANPVRDDMEGQICLARMVVLARTRFALKPIEAALTASDISFVLRQGKNGVDFDSEMMQVFDLGLCLLTNPQSKIHANRLLQRLSLGDLRSQTGQGLGFLENLSNTVADAWGERYGICLEAWRTIAAVETKLRQALIKMSDTVRSAKGWEDDERLRILTDIETMLECWKFYVQKAAPSRLSLSGFRAKMSLGLVGPSEESDVLTLATVHSVKGMEFDIVFLASMVEGVFPDYRARPGTRSMREEKNDAFVAMTRARRLLYITFPEARKMPWGGVRSQKVSHFVTLTGIYPLRSDPHQDALVAEG